MLELAKGFRCSVCDEKRNVQPRHRASLEPLPPRFHTIAADVGHWQHPGTREHRFRVSRILSRGPKQQPSAALCLQFLQEGWIQYFGCPKTLRLDPAGSFRSKAVESLCDRHQVFLDIIPGEAHWQLGICDEQAIKGVKEVMSKMSSADEDLSPEEVLSQAVYTFNHRDLVRGYSPVQHILGQAPDATGRHIPGLDVLPEDLIPLEPTEDHARNARLRAEAEKAHVDWNAAQRLQRAQNSSPRPVKEFLPGDLVFF